MKSEIRLVTSEYLREQAEALKSGSGDGTFDGMEARVKRLEDDMKEIKGDLKTLVKDIAEIKGRLSAMPTMWQLLGMVIAIMGATFAFVRFGLTGIN